MNNSLHAHLPILVQIALGLALPVIILVVSHLFGQRVRREARYPSRDEAYECGLVPESGAENPHPRNAIKYCAAAMLFILFDIEVVFLVPWALSFRELSAVGIGIAAPSAIFIGLLAFGLFYEHRRGAFEWDSPARPARPQSANLPAPPRAKTAPHPTHEN